jgi:RNA polymerase sigma-70 factor (ECF subfamily)
MSSQQEALWLVQAQCGDREALDRLLQAVQERLYGYLFNLVRDHHLAGDLLQDVFVIVIRKLRWLREPSAFLPWAYRIASRQALRALKQKRRAPERSEDTVLLQSLAGPMPEEPFAPEMIERLPALLEEVSPASRAVLLLHYLQEMTLQEVADVLEIPVGTAKARLAYGLQTLRKKLKPATPAGRQELPDDDRHGERAC